MSAIDRQEAARYPISGMGLLGFGLWLGLAFGFLEAGHALAAFLVPGRPLPDCRSCGSRPFSTALSSRELAWWRRCDRSFCPGCPGTFCCWRSWPFSAAFWPPSCTPFSSAGSRR